MTFPSRIASAMTPKPAHYKLRRSSRYDDNAIELTPDGDTWQEKICVCEGLGPDGKTPRLILKSYYRNNRTQHKVWDEPPTGASAVRFASQQDRRKAEAKLKELQQTLTMIPLESSPAPTASKSPKKAKGVALFGRFRRSKDTPTEEIHESRDVNLQKAIARSMMDHHRPREIGTSGGGGAGVGSSINDSVIAPTVHYDPERGSAASGYRSSRGSSASKPFASPKSGSTSNPFDDPNEEDDEEMALAKALSVSESYASSAAPFIKHPVSPHESPVSTSTLSEDEMLRLAIRESQRDATRERRTYATSVRERRSKRPSRNYRLSHQDERRSFQSSPELVREEGVGDWDRIQQPRRAQGGAKEGEYCGDDNFYDRRYSNRSYHHRRRVTRAKDPPADPPSRYMEEDNDEEDAEVENDCDERPYLDRHRANPSGRATSVWKAEW